MSLPARPPTWLVRLNTPWATLAIGLLAYGGFATLRLAKQGWDPSAFVRAGDEYCDTHATPPGLSVAPGNSGYDGQYFYRLALDPFTHTARDYGIRLDVPAYRHQRVLYPLLVWFFSAGQPRLVPSLLIAVNLAALAVVAGAAGAIARSLSRHALWGLLIVAHPGFVLTLARDTAELVEAALLLLGVLALIRERFGWAAGALALAVLAKETSLGVALAAGVAAVVRLWRREGSAGWWLAAGAPVATYGAWQLALAAVWGVAPLRSGQQNLGAPGVALAELVADAFAHGDPYRLLWRSALVLFGLAVLVAGVALWRRQGPLLVRVAWGLYAALALCLSGLVWSEHWAFARALTELYVCSVILALAAGPRLRGALGVVALVVWYVIARAARRG